MLNPSAEREVNNNYKLSTEKARQWWNNQAFESRKNIVIESDAVINDDQEVEDQMVADIADSDYDNLPDITQQEIDSKIDDEEDIEQIFNLEGESYLQCSKCDDLFTSNEDYDLHKDVDHGEEPEDFEESDETYKLAMNPDLTREALREANSLLTETEERQLYGGYDKNGEIQSSVMPYNLPPVATGKYNDNPNSFFYSNKIFRAGDSSLRTSSLGEARAKAREWQLPAELQGLIPDSGSVNDPDLEELRKAMNTYYEVSNNGGGNWYEGADADTTSLMRNYNLSNTERLEAFHVDNHENPYDEDGYDIEIDQNEEDRLMNSSLSELESLINQLIEKAKGKRNENNWNAWESKASESNLDFTDYMTIDEDDIATCDLCGMRYDMLGTSHQKLKGHLDTVHGIVTEAKISSKRIPKADLYQGGQKVGIIEDYNPRQHEGYVTLDGIGIKEFGALPSAYTAYLNGEKIPNKWDNQVDYNASFFGESGEDDYEERPEWEWLTNKSPAPEVDYDQVEYEDDGVSDISVPNTEPKGEDKNEFLDDVDYTGEAVNYVYPTKATESTKSYITESEPYEEEYEEFENSDEELIEETISIRKLTGYSDNSIAQELHINYGVSHEEALEKVYSVEVSTNDRVAQTFFGKMYKECTESEKDELRMYSGSD
jgi:hypothetical protein